MWMLELPPVSPRPERSEGSARAGRSPRCARGAAKPFLVLTCLCSCSFVSLALLLLAVGSGVIKPNISTLMGETYDEKRPGNERLRSAAFMWFYFSINIGALLSQFGLPIVRQNYILNHVTPAVKSELEQAL